MKVVIIAGGSGTRLWPLSRERNPKQLQRILDGKSLLEVTVERAQSLVPLTDIFLVISNSFQLTEVEAQLTNFTRENILQEPSAKNTAAAIAYGAATLARRGFGDETMVVLSADHVIANPDVLWEAVRMGNDFLTTHPATLLTIGIPPRHAETGYGYIERGELLAPGIYRVAKFHEKPAREVAEQYQQSGKHLWNAGIFVWKVKTILESLPRNSPEHNPIIEAVWRHSDLAAAYEQVPNIAIDYAVSEKEKNLAVVPADLEWRDIGHWQSLKTHLQKTREDTVVIGQHVGVNTKNSLIINNSDRLIATVGLDNVVVVDTGDTLLVCDADQAQDLKKLIETLRETETLNELL